MGLENENDDWAEIPIQQIPTTQISPTPIDDLAADDDWMEIPTEKAKQEKGFLEDIYGTGKAFMRGIDEGASFGWGEEFSGFIKGAIFDDDNEKFRDRERALNKQALDEYPGAYHTGSFIGGVGSPLTKVGQALKLGNITRSAIEGAVFAGGLSEEKTAEGVLKDVAVGGTIGAAIPAGLKGIGASAGAVGRGIGKAIPGTKHASDWVNKWTSKAANVFSKNTMGAEKIEAFYKNPEMRRRVRDTFDKEDEIEKLANILTDADSKISLGLKKRLGELKKEFLSAGEGNVNETLTDVRTFLGVFKSVKKANRRIAESPKQYTSSVRREIKAVEDVLAKNTKYKKGVDKYSPNRYIKDSLHTARQNIDTAKKATGLKVQDLDILNSLRDEIDDAIKNKVSGGPARQKSDELFSDFKADVENFFTQFKEFEGKGAFKKGRITEKKVARAFRGTLGNMKEMNRKAKKVFDFAQKHGEELDIPEVQTALNSIKTFQDELQNVKLMSSIDYMGGPTGTAVNNANTTWQAIRNGISLVVMPITNPAMWAKVVDQTSSTLDSIAQRAAFKNLVLTVDFGSKALMREMIRANVMKEKDTIEDEF